jgi:hypothetical protein
MLRVLLYQRFPNYHFIRDFAEDFARAGHVAEWIPANEGPRLREHVARFKPDFVFCVGASNAAAKLLDGRVPLVFYELDKILNTALWDDTPVGERDTVFTTYREDIPLFRSFGFKHVHYLPFCPNIRRNYTVRLTAQPDHAISFIGSIVRDQTNDYQQLLRRGQMTLAPGTAHRRLFDELVRFLEGVLADQERHWGTHTERIQTHFSETLPPLVEAASRLFHLPAPALANTVAKEAAHRQRLYWLSRFTEVHLWGPEAPDPPSPRVVYHGAADQYEESGPLFANSAVNFHLQRIYARDGLSDRVFNVLFVGGCLLADPNTPLLELFEPGRELETYASPEELQEKTARLLGDRDYRVRLGLNGGRCVRSRHLFKHRLRKLLTLIPLGEESRAAHVRTLATEAASAPASQLPVPSPTGGAAS